MQIYLAKPAGQKEGPFSLDQINQELAAGKIRDSEYWAWHEGIPQWVPLYAMEGVSSQAGRLTAGTASTAANATTSHEPEPMPVAKVERVSVPAEAAASVSAAVLEPEEPAPLGSPEVFAPMPFASLEHIFVFTTGDGRLVFDFPMVAEKLQETIGEELRVIREKVPVDVVGNADVGVDIMTEDVVPDKAWRAMHAIRPEIARKAKDGLYHICIRSFAVDTEDSVAFFLLYNKEKMQEPV